LTRTEAWESHFLADNSVLYHPETDELWLYYEARDTVTSVRTGLAKATIIKPGHPPHQTEELFYNEEIRDTNTHNSKAADCRIFKNKTFLLVNTLDQSVDFQVQASWDRAFTDPVNIGSPVTLAAGNVTTQRDYAVTDYYFPYFRVQATAAGVPTTGNVNVKVLKGG